jgi:hypothetical protein
MVLNTDVTISYKCPFCGSFQFFSFSLFKINTDYLECSFRCKCGYSHITVGVRRNRELYLTVPCIGCGGIHTYTIPKNLFKDDCIKEYKCPVTGIRHCFLGVYYKVVQKVDTLEREFDNIVDMSGYESYFKNNRVMLDVLNRIHDIAGKGELLCECGSNDFELNLMPRGIDIRCKKCKANEFIKASSNEDIKGIFEKDSIIIGKRNSGIYDPILIKP